LAKLDRIPMDWGAFASASVPLLALSSVNREARSP
jgi:hypothetical protein